MFLDYDGTISPIVKQPERAFMSDEMRAAVKRVAALYPTAVISGRSREKVYDFVQIPELYYAGSHGLDIVGPRGIGVFCTLVPIRPRRRGERRSLRTFPVAFSPPTPRFQSPPSAPFNSD